MKLKLLTFGTLLGIFFVCSAMESTVITMPKADILRHQLDIIGMGPVIRNTNIIQQLAKQKKPIGYVVSVVNNAMQDYHQYLNRTHPISVGIRLFVALKREDAIRIGGQIILQTLLRDYPEALAECIRVAPNRAGNWGDTSDSDTSECWDII